MAITRRVAMIYIYSKALHHSYSYCYSSIKGTRILFCESELVEYC